MRRREADSGPGASARAQEGGGGKRPAAPAVRQRRSNVHLSTYQLLMLRLGVCSCLHGGVQTQILASNMDRHFHFQVGFCQC